MLDKNTKFCYTYDNLNRVTSRIAKKLDDNSVISTETFSYDAAGNIIGGLLMDAGMFIDDSTNDFGDFLDVANEYVGGIVDDMKDTGAKISNELVDGISFAYNWVSSLFTKH